MKVMMSLYTTTDVVLYGFNLGLKADKALLFINYGIPILLYTTPTKFSKHIKTIRNKIALITYTLVILNNSNYYKNN